LAQGTQPKKAESVTFTTGDYAELKGYWYPGDKRKESATVILLHRLGGQCREDGWESLAENLNKKGYAVLAFDFRGHGRSTGVDAKKFWAGQFAHNTSYIKSYRPGAMNPPNAIEFGDFRPEYMPHLINDIYAAKVFIEGRNDKAECNANRIILIGAEDGATLGMMFTAAEFYRYKVSPRGEFEPTPESRDILCCVWLSLSTSLDKKPVSGSLTQWLTISAADKENKIPMAFLYGEEDKKADTLSLQATRILKPLYGRGKEINEDKFPATGDHAVEKSQKLSGSKLLNKDLETEKWIVDVYLNNTVFKKKEKSTEVELNQSVERFKKMSFDWNERSIENKIFMYKIGTRPALRAKDPLEKAMLPVPIGSLGLVR